MKNYEQLRDEVVPKIEELLIKVQGNPVSENDYKEIIDALTDFSRAMVDFSIGVCILAQAINPDPVAETGEYDEDVKQLTIKEGR